MDSQAREQLRVIREVIAVLRTEGISAWLFGGWGLDARIGRITREHGDVEFWVERIHAEQSKVLIEGIGGTALSTQPSEEACEFVLGGTVFSTAYGRPWRQKDIVDMEILRGLLAAGTADNPMGAAE